MNRAAALAVALLALGSSAALASPKAKALTFRPVCANFSCRAFVAVDPDGKVHADAAPNGIGATDLQSAYNIDATLGSGTTVAVVEGNGYAAIESDLAMYRSQFGLPPCTIASGCLTVVNDDGETSPLPADDPDGIIESALDISMVSAGCPNCKILVVEGGGLGGEATQLGQIAAAKLGVDAIADSYGGPEDGSELTTQEGNYNNPGTGTFVSTGDYGNNMVSPGHAGPSYPATSAFVIAVGGTHLAKVDPSVNPRGWVETAWSQAGSSCSTSIPKQSWAPVSAACGMRATGDISAMADPNPGLAIYIAAQGGWTTVGGTSASAPLTAAIFAGAGHATASPAFVYKHADIFTDITIGENGGCGTTMCNAGTGWDGPTGLGSPDQGKLKAVGNVVGMGPDVTISFPADGATVQPGFTIQAMPDDTAVYIQISIDGVNVKALDIAPYMISAPTTLMDGTHTVTVTAFDLDHNSKSTMINITQSSSGGTDGGGNSGGGGGCAAGGSTGGAGLVLALGMLTVRRRRRT